MLVWGFDTDYLIGPATITMEGIEIGPTLKSEDVTLTLKPITQEIKTDESPEVKEVIQTGEGIEVSFGIPYTSDLAEMFGMLGENIALTRTAEVIIQSEGLKITIYKGSVVMTISKRYAWDKINTVSVTVKGLVNDSGKKYKFELVE